MKAILAFLKKNWVYDLALIALVLVIFSPVSYSATIENPTITDYGAHARLAIQLILQVRGGPERTLPEVYTRGGWQVFIIALHELTGLPYNETSFVATLLCILASALLIFHIFKPTLEKRRLSPWWGLGIALGLNLVTPVFLLAPLDNLHYFGYIGMITYHNPTSIMLRPVAILQFVFALACIRDKTSPWPHVLFAAFLSVLGLYIKPNYALCLLPALGSILLYRLLGRQTVNWRMTILGFALPSAVVLLVQFLFVYADSSGDKAIAFQPFAAMAVYSDYLLPKFFLSILFPLLVAILFFKDSIKDDRMILAWVMFFFGMILTYFFAEGGGSFMALNFVWGGHIVTWILFGLSLLLLIEKAPASIKWKIWTPALVAGMHLIAGVIYYGYCLLAYYD